MSSRTGTGTLTAGHEEDTVGIDGQAGDSIQVGHHGVYDFTWRWERGVTVVTGMSPTPSPSLIRANEGPKQTCPVVKEADAAVIAGGDGEGLRRVAHHLVDLAATCVGTPGSGPIPPWQ